MIHKLLFTVIGAAFIGLALFAFLRKHLLQVFDLDTGNFVINMLFMIGFVAFFAIIPIVGYYLFKSK